MSALSHYSYRPSTQALEGQGTFHSSADCGLGRCSGRGGADKISPSVCIHNEEVTCVLIVSKYGMTWKVPARKTTTKKQQDSCTQEPSMSRIRVGYNSFPWHPGTRIRTHEGTKYLPYVNSKLSAYWWWLWVKLPHNMKSKRLKKVTAFFTDYADTKRPKYYPFIRKCCWSSYL